jgi:hypothetical protein
MRLAERISFLDQYGRIAGEYARLASRQLCPIASAIVRQGYSVTENWIGESEIEAMRAAFPPLDQLKSEPQSPAVHTLHNAAQTPALATFFNDPRVRAVATSIIGDKAMCVRDWAQVRTASGPRGAFDEFYHVDSFKHRLKAFLYLTDVGPGDGTLLVVPNSAHGRWHASLAQELFDVETRSQAKWDNEDASYETISGSLEFHFAGCLTHYSADRIFRKAGLRPKPLYAKAGTLIMWDSRHLHRHEPSTRRDRYMLEAVWARAGTHG